MRISDWSSDVCSSDLLGGNELPNSPRLTFNLGAQYTAFIDGGDWELTFRGDYYRQSKSFARVYNTEYDRLKAWDNLNLAVTLARTADDFALPLYVKNVFNKTPIRPAERRVGTDGVSTARSRWLRKNKK